MLISLYIIVGVVLMTVGVLLTVFVRLIPTKKDVASLPKASRIGVASVMTRHETNRPVFAVDTEGKGFLLTADARTHSQYMKV